VHDFISRLEAKDEIKKKAAAFFKQNARYYLAKKNFHTKHEVGAITDKDKEFIKNSLLEKLKAKKNFKECLQ
jgi:hypothetical protein